MKRAIHIKGAPEPIGPYSQAILINDTLYISGQIPVNPVNGQLEMNTIEEATHRILLNIDLLLAEVDMTFSDVVKCSIFLKNMDDFTSMNAVYGTYFKECPPARETVQVSKLPLDVSIEISCIAVK